MTYHYWASGVVGMYTNENEEAAGNSLYDYYNGTMNKNTYTIQKIEGNYLYINSIQFPYTRDSSQDVTIQE